MTTMERERSIVRNEQGMPVVQARLKLVRLGLERRWRVLVAIGPVSTRWKRIGQVRAVRGTDTYQWTGSVSLLGGASWSKGRRLTPMNAAAAMYATLQPALGER